MFSLASEAKVPLLLSAAIVAAAAFLGGVYADSLGVVLISSTS